MAVATITAAKEEVRRSIIVTKLVEGGGRGCITGSYKHWTVTQEGAVCVQYESESVQ